MHLNVCCLPLTNPRLFSSFHLDTVGLQHSDQRGLTCLTQTWKRLRKPDLLLFGNLIHVFLFSTRLLSSQKLRHILSVLTSLTFSSFLSIFSCYPLLDLLKACSQFVRERDYVVVEIFFWEHRTCSFDS